MFKKRNNNQKKLDLHQEAQQIQLNDNENPQEPEHNQHSQEQTPNLIAITPIRNRNKGNSITLETLEIGQLKEIKQNKREQIKLEKEEIDDCLNEIKKIKHNELINSENQETQPKIAQTLLVQQQPFNNYDSEEYNDQYLLEVEEDLQGGFSPQRDHDPYHQDYEDQLIKKTLTKRNYEQVQLKGGHNLGHLKALEARDKILDKIQKVSAKRIENTIKRDLENKKKKLDELLEDVRLKKGSIDREQKEIQKKERRLNEMRGDFERINKVIEFLYYYGDQISTFQTGAILRQIKEQEKAKESYNFEDVE